VEAPPEPEVKQLSVKQRRDQERKKKAAPKAKAEPAAAAAAESKAESKAETKAADAKAGAADGKAGSRPQTAEKNGDATTPAASAGAAGSSAATVATSAASAASGKSPSRNLSKRGKEEARLRALEDEAKARDEAKRREDEEKARAMLDQPRPYIFGAAKFSLTDLFRGACCFVVLHHASIWLPQLQGACLSGSLEFSLISTVLPVYPPTGTVLPAVSQFAWLGHVLRL
jgi:hypothetical protein